MMRVPYLGFASGWRVKSGLKYSKYSVYGSSLAGDIFSFSYKNLTIGSKKLVATTKYYDLNVKNLQYLYTKYYLLSKRTLGR